MMNGQILARRWASPPTPPTSAQTSSRRRTRGLPATWEEFIEASKKVTKPPFYAYGMALGLVPSDSLGDVMSVVSAYGGSLIDAQNRPALESDATVQAFKLIRTMYNDAKIIPRGALSWDNSGNNKAFSRAR